MKINKHYAALSDSYLFSTVARKVREYRAEHPESEVVSLGIGDVTRPLALAVRDAMQNAVAEMGDSHTFRGYGEEQGYGFLRQAVCDDYKRKGVVLNTDEVFISDGAKSDIGNMLDIVSKNNTVFIPDPVYPVYRDTNLMAGRHIVYGTGNEENGFLPMPSRDTAADIVYLCSPNNPTGAVYTHAQLQEWVDYANRKDAIILFDAAYEAFVRDKTLPVSIYEVDGAKECAIEFCSLSKTAGFTGTRCGYTVVPKSLVREQTMLNRLWLRRQSTKFNGVSYVVQRGAEAVFSQAGREQIQADIGYYCQNAKRIADTLLKLGIPFTGGVNSPYVWFRCPGGLSSWEFFDKLLAGAQIVGTPGSGFGAAGEGYFRFTAFGLQNQTELAMKNFENFVTSEQFI